MGLRRSCPARQYPVTERPVCDLIPNPAFLFSFHLRNCEARILFFSFIQIQPSRTEGALALLV
ncbi:hypothetical protein KSP40_PGU008844 [Platanthera guangdongensis]|uniref:Uncharacterized protein n=1 Tax=Platanthera guangdongensis TaxID=2320717 RepID=A0ABR2MPU8_9ASPA